MGEIFYDLGEPLMWRNWGIALQFVDMVLYSLQHPQGGVPVWAVTWSWSWSHYWRSCLKYCPLVACRDDMTTIQMMVTHIIINNCAVVLFLQCILFCTKHSYFIIILIQLIHQIWLTVTLELFLILKCRYFTAYTVHHTGVFFSLKHDGTSLLTEVYLL